MSERIKMTRTIPGLIKVDEAYEKKKFYRDQVEKTIREEIMRDPSKSKRIQEGEA